MDFPGVEWWVGRRARDHEVAAEVIRRGILVGTIATGKYLPSEQVLMVRMGITRYSVRVALAQLASEGLIQKIHGRGSRVLDVTAHASVSVLPAMMRVQDNGLERMKDLLKYRAAQMLLAIGALIAGKGAPSKVAHDALFALGDLTSSDWYASRVMELEEWLWGVLGGSVANEVVRLSSHRLRRLLCGFHSRIPAMMKLEPQTALFEELFAAIKEGNRLKAYALAETGLNARNRFYLRLLETPQQLEPLAPDPLSDGAPAMDG